MRRFAFVFAFYLFAITLAPCQDEYTCEDMAAHEATHSHEDDDMDTCSPFCICKCCSTASVISIDVLTLLFPKVIHYQQNNSPYTASIPAPVYYAIWQPPKL